MTYHLVIPDIVQTNAFQRSTNLHTRNNKLLNMDIDQPMRWAEMREQIQNTEWVIRAIVAKHGDKMPCWGDWPSLIEEAYSAVGKKWNEPVMVPIPFEPGWQSVLPPKPEKTRLPNSGPNGEIIFGTKKLVEDPNYALSISSISDDSDYWDDSEDEEEEDDVWGEDEETKHDESENDKVVVHIKDLSEGTRLEDIPRGTIVELDESDIEISDTPIGEESDNEVELSSLKECLEKMGLEKRNKGPISLETDVRIRAAYEVYEIDQDWDEFQDTCQRIINAIAKNNTIVLGPDEKIGPNGIEARHIEEETVIPMDQIEVVITEKEGTIPPDEYDHVENVIAPAKTHIGAVLKQWSGSCQKHPGCVWDLLCDCSNCDAITGQAGF